MAEQVKAYILVQTTVSGADVAKELRRLDQVESADDVSGPYDVIARVAAANMDELGKVVVDRIQTVEGITRTLTCPIVEL